MLNVSQQAMLKHASKTNGRTAEKIKAIDEAVAHLMTAYPEKFHDEKSLLELVLFHRPFKLELKEYSHAIYQNSPYGVLK